MKNSVIKIFSILILFFIKLTSFCQPISIPKACKLMQGDNLEWASPIFNDADWSIKQLGQSWAAADNKPNVYAWYRIKVVVPLSFKESAEKNNGVKLSLGKIDDIDQTFFNGRLVGETGSFPPNYIGKWDVERHYIINPKDVNWGNENVIAVRIFSPDFGGIGMYAGPYTIEPIGWPDFVTLSESIVATSNNGFFTKIKFDKKTNFVFEGAVKYWIKNKTNTILFSETKEIKLLNNLEGSKEISFTNFEPTSEDFFTIGYEILDNNSNITIKKEQYYLANNNIEIPVASDVQALVKDKAPNAYIPSFFSNQQFNGYLGKRMLQNLQQRLLQVDEYGLCGTYLSKPGIHPWAGEHIGKYLETACNVWKNTHNPQLKMQMDRIMYKLINSQSSDGYLGTYTPDDYWTSWDVWSHKYNLHGLLAYYKTFGYKPALEACKKMGYLMCKTFGNKENQKNIITAGEHKGMAATSILDAMIELYKYTNDKKYLNFCYYILDAWEQNNGPKIISNILSTGNVAKVGNGKAYEMISNFVGLIKLYRITGDMKLLKPVLLAWQNIVDKKLYITGTTSSWEYFQEDEVLPAAEKDHMGEGCVTTTWLQLNQNLYEIFGDVKYYNQIEKSIYNHLLAAENPETGCVSYYTPLMSKKPYTCYITCCQSSVPRGISLIPNFAFGKINNIPTLLNYEPATFAEENYITTINKTLNLNINVQSSFPESGNINITVNTSLSAKFPLAFFVPSWCKNYRAIVNGNIYKGKPNEYLQINRIWKMGDKVVINFDMPVVVIEGGKSYPNQIAFKRGPQVLAFDDSFNKNIGLDSAQILFNTNLIKSKIALPKQWVGKQIFEATLTNNKIINLVPFADASQTGGEVKVWLPISINKIKTK